MSLIWHIAVKDLRRNRVLVAFWIGLIAAKLGIGVMLLFGTGGQFDPLRFGNYGLAALETLTGFFMVAAVVHDDLLVGANSFWMTRPISSERLFAGKLAGLALLFAVIPLTLHLPWWVLCGYGVRDILFGSAEILLIQACVVGAALPLATLTDGLGRYLFGTFIMVAAVIFSGVLVPSIPGGGRVLVLSILGISGLVCAFVQALKQRFLVGGTLLGGSVAAPLILVAFWNPGPTSRTAPAPVPPSQNAEAINLAFVRAQAQARVRRANERAVTVTIRSEGVPPELILQGFAAHEWRWGNGLRFERGGALQGGAADEASRLALGVNAYASNSGLMWPAFLAGQGNAPNLAGSEVYLPVGFSTQVQQEPPSYLLRADISLMRPVVMAERAAKKGEILVSTRETSRVISSELHTETRRNPLGAPIEYRQIRVRLSEYRPFVFDETGKAMGFGPFLFSGWPSRSYFLVNRARGVVARNNVYREYDTPRSQVVRIGTVGIVWRICGWNPPRNSSVEPSLVEDTAWFEKASIAKVQLREEERFTKELSIERFELAPDARRGNR